MQRATGAADASPATRMPGPLFRTLRIAGSCDDVKCDDSASPELFFLERLRLGLECPEVSPLLNVDKIIKKGNIIVSSFR